MDLALPGSARGLGTNEKLLYDELRYDQSELRSTQVKRPIDDDVLQASGDRVFRLLLCRQNLLQWFSITC